MQKYYYSQDYNGNKHKIMMPEERITPLERGGVWDLIPWGLLIGLIVWFI